MAVLRAQPELAGPVASEFFTLSPWRDRPALDTFVRSEPHRSLMRRYHPAMADAKFVF